MSFHHRPLLFPPGGLATFTDVTIGFPEASTAGAVGAADIGFPPIWVFFVPAAGNSAGSYFF